MKIYYNKEEGDIIDMYKGRVAGASGAVVVADVTEVTGAAGVTWALGTCGLGGIGVSEPSGLGAMEPWGVIQ